MSEETKQSKEFKPRQILCPECSWPLCVEIEPGLYEMRHKGKYWNWKTKEEEPRVYRAIIAIGSVCCPRDERELKLPVF